MSPIDYAQFGAPSAGGCATCGHPEDRHVRAWAGICVGCPCETFVPADGD